MSTRKALIAAGLATVASVALAGCAGTGTTSSANAAAATPSSNQKVTLTVWSAFTGRELSDFGNVMAGFHKLHPNITIKNVGNEDDTQIIQAVRGGDGPDVALSFSGGDVGQYCGTGTFQNLEPYIKRDHVDMNNIPKATREYTSFKGVQCSMPLLADVYALYYNTKLFKAAGITAPPKTIAELTQDAKKLTVRGPDGSIKVAGFVPTPAFYANNVDMLAPQFGASWRDANGKSAVASNPGWANMLTWQKNLTDWYGQSKLKAFTASAGQQFAADQDFQTGKIAMAFDGEFRTAFIKAGAPDLQYATAPFPVDGTASYNTAFTTGNLIGIPKGAKNVGAAWELVKYLSTNTHALVQLANALDNVPTWKPALDSPELNLPAQFKTFLDLYDHGTLVTDPPTADGDAYVASAQTFANSYVAGSVSDLNLGLKKLATQIDNQSSLGQ